MEANIRGAVGRSASIPDRWSGISSAGSGNNPSQNKRKKVQNNERQKDFRHDRSDWRNGRGALCGGRVFT